MKSLKKMALVLGVVTSLGVTGITAYAAAPDAAAVGVCSLCDGTDHSCPMYGTEHTCPLYGTEHTCYYEQGQRVGGQCVNRQNDSRGHHGTGGGHRGRHH